MSVDLRKRYNFLGKYIIMVRVFDGPGVAGAVLTTQSPKVDFFFKSLKWVILIMIKWIREGGVWGVQPFYTSFVDEVSFLGNPTNS